MIEYYVLRSFACTEMNKPDFVAQDNSEQNTENRSKIKRSIIIFIAMCGETANKTKYHTQNHRATNCCTHTNWNVEFSEHKRDTMIVWVCTIVIAVVHLENGMNVSLNNGRTRHSSKLKQQTISVGLAAIVEIVEQ